MKIRIIAWRNIRRNRRRSLLSATATAVAAMAIVFMFSLIGGVKADFKYNLSTFVTGHVQVLHSDYDMNEHMNPIHLRIEEISALREILNRDEKIEAMSPRINFVSGINQDGEFVPAFGVGLDFDTETEYQDFSTQLIEGRIPVTGEKEALITSGLAKNMNLEVGDKFTFVATTMRRAQNALTVKVVGIASLPIGGMNNSYFYIPLDRAQRTLQMGDSVTHLLIKANNEKRIDELKDSVNTVLGQNGYGDVQARTWKEANLFYSYFSLAEIIYGIMAMVFFVLASTVLINTTMMVIFERMREIGTIAAMGMKGKEIVKLFFLEGAFLAMIGSAAGVVIGIVLSLVTSKVGLDFGDAMANMDFEISNVFYPKLSWFSTVFVFIYSTIVTAIAAVIPSRRASRIQPVEALRSL